MAVATMAFSFVLIAFFLPLPTAAYKSHDDKAEGKWGGLNQDRCHKEIQIKARYVRPYGPEAPDRHMHDMTFKNNAAHTVVCFTYGASGSGAIEVEATSRVCLEAGEWHESWDWGGKDARILVENVKFMPQTNVEYREYGPYFPPDLHMRPFAECGEPPNTFYKRVQAEKDAKKREGGGIRVGSGYDKWLWLRLI